MNDDMIVGTGYELITGFKSANGLIFGPYGPFALTDKFKVLKEAELYGGKTVRLRAVEGMKWHEVVNQATNEVEGIFIHEGVTISEIFSQLKEKYGANLQIIEEW